MIWKFTWFLLALGVCVGQIPVAAFADAQTPAPATPTTASATSASAQPAPWVVPQTPGTYRLFTTLRVAGKSMKLPFVVFLPDSYRATGPKTPVLLFLHGMGEGGTDLDGIFLHGPNFELVKPNNDAFIHRFPMIVVSPQCPPRGERWDRGTMVDYANLLLDELLPKLNADADRVYATGLSAGGLGTWLAALNRPDLFAAIAPISSREPDLAEVAKKLHHLPTLAITGEGDNDQIAGSRSAVDALNNAGGYAQLVTGPDGHAVWIRAYANIRTYEWLLLQSRDQPLPATNPSTQPTPQVATRAGFHVLTHRAASGAQIDSLPYVIYLPADLRPGDHRPLVMYLPDSTRFGTYRDGMVLHGPAEQLATSARLRNRFDAILVQPIFPPFAGKWPDNANLAMLSSLIQDLARRYHTDPERLYIAGSGTGVATALALAQRPNSAFAAALLEIPADAAELAATLLDTASPTVILGYTYSNKGPNPGRLRTLTTRSATGSDLTILPADAPSPFAMPEIYERLLAIRLKPQPKSP